MIVINAYQEVYSNNHSLLHDGVDEYVQVADDNVFSFGNGGTDSPFSFGSWNKIDGTAVNMCSKNAGGTNIEYVYGFDNLGFMFVFLNQNDGSTWIGRVTNATLVSDGGSWIFYSFSYDGSKTSAGIKLYRNGTLQASSSSSSGAYPGMSNTTAPFRIGYNGAAAYMKGNMYNPILWNKEVSAAEFGEVYLNPYVDPRTLTAGANVIFGGRFVNGTADYPTETDYVNGRNGTMTNMESGDIVTDRP